MRDLVELICRCGDKVLCILKRLKSCQFHMTLYIRYILHRQLFLSYIFVAKNHVLQLFMSACIPILSVRRVRLLYILYFIQHYKFQLELVNTILLCRRSFELNCFQCCIWACDIEGERLPHYQTQCYVYLL